jgi:hypothetical protein
MTEKEIESRRSLYTKKLEGLVIDFISNLEFEKKNYVIGRLKSICHSMIYSAPEAYNSWIEEFFGVLNQYLLIIDEENQKKLQELLKE